MTRTSLLALLLLSPLASAEEGGETAFNRACAGCHAANVAPRGKKSTGGKAAPELEVLLGSRTPQQLREWVQAPHKVRPQTHCDTRLLEASEVDSLLSYLATRSQPPPPPREELLRQQLQRELAERRVRKQRQTDDAVRRQP